MKEKKRELIDARQAISFLACGGEGEKGKEKRLVH